MELCLINSRIKTEWEWKGNDEGERKSERVGGFGCGGGAAGSVSMDMVYRELGRGRKKLLLAIRRKGLTLHPIPIKYLEWLVLYNFSSTCKKDYEPQKASSKWEGSWIHIWGVSAEYLHQKTKKQKQ